MFRNRSRGLATLAAVLSLPLLASVASAQDTRPTIAVLDFDNNSIGRNASDYAAIGKGIADLLIGDLAAGANIRVVERDRIQALLDEQKLTRDGHIDQETAVRLGKLLGARHMITGGFMSTGSQMVLTARTIDVETREISNPQRVQQSDDDVLGLIGKLSTRLTSSLKLPPIERRTGDAGHHGHHGAAQAGAPAPAAQPRPAAAPASSAKPARLDLRTALLYSKALEAQDAGDRARAVELYDQVLDKFPDLEQARANRDRLHASGD